MRAEMKGSLLICAAFLFFVPTSLGFRTWVCRDHKCVKEDVDKIEKSVSIGECKVMCLEYAGMWPMPTGNFSMGNRTHFVDVSGITFLKHEYPEKIGLLLKGAEENFMRRIKRDTDVVDYSAVDVLHKVDIELEIYDPSVYSFVTNTDESYKLLVTPPPNGVKPVTVTIRANTLFGLRHALETLSQLVFYDDIRQVHKMLAEVTIADRPVYTHRGIVLDTARSYISVDNILQLLDVMGANKLNTFHWHITDSQSFPYVSLAYPQLSRDGAYSKQEVYTQNDIKRIVNHAQSLGIRVVPEFDAPAHVGEGWNALDPKLITCFKWQPWREYCVEPPCGQLDPTNQKVYEVLGTIFKEYVNLFPSDLFHMGGDEVNINCWRSTPRIVEWMTKNNYTLTDKGYYRLWGEYQAKMLRKLRETKTDPHPQAILWTSSLTQPNVIKDYLHPNDYIIQIWTSKLDQTIKTLIQNKFQVIFSNYDELYFDCGGPSWVGSPGQNWCSPYIGWQYVYGHDPRKILERQGINATDEIMKLVLGSEAAIWTEQIDDHNLHLRLWPRAAALGERLWSNPTGDWTDAQFRMNHHRERLAQKAPAELLQPRWCYQNDGYCD